MFERILLPVDGSEHAARAAEHAIDLADRYDAALDVLYVAWTDAPYAGEGTPGLEVEEFARLHEQEGHGITREIVSRAQQAGVEAVEPVLVRAPDIAGAILEHAESAAVDLIVMGTRGRSGLARFVLGSVTDRVIRESPVPVMTVRAPDASDEG